MFLNVRPVEKFGKKIDKKFENGGDFYTPDNIYNRNFAKEGF